MSKNMGNIWAAEIRRTTDITLVAIEREIIMGKYAWTNYGVTEDGWVIIPAPKKETIMQWLLRKVGL